MEMLKRVVILVGILLLFVNVCHAMSFDVDSDVVQDTIIKNGDATFDISIRNKQSFTDTITYVLSDLNWEWDKKFFTLDRNEIVSFELKLGTPLNVKPGMYNLNLKVYSQSNPEVYDYESLIIKVLDYSDLLKIEDLNKAIPLGLDPRKENLVKLNLKNINNLNLDDVVVKLESDIFEKEFVFNFEPSEAKLEEFYIDIDDLTKEGTYNVRVLAMQGKNVLIDRIDKVRVSYYSDIQENKEESSGFLTKTLLITRENRGNIDSLEEYKVSLNSFEKTFTRTSPKPTSIRKNEGVYYYTWNFELGPGETYRISVKTNYRDPLIFLILFGIMAYLVYTFLATGLSLKKKVLTLKSSSGISDMKVLLILKNKGNGVIKNIKLMDTLPKVVKTPEEYGTLKPSETKTNFHGNKVLIWKLENLVGKEERVISYRVKLNMGVLGKFGVQRAVCAYRKGNKNIITKSNKNIVFS